MTFVYILVLILFVLLISEYLYLSLCIRRIPLRILVNGTRGKSSVVKYIAAGLRASDKKTIAKITGIVPTIIYPDGSNSVIKRIGPARVQEQFKLIRLASRLSADCLVLECMSITPELQKLESKIFKPHIYVITNIKDDHQETMGNPLEQVDAICNAIPSDSVVITGEIKYKPQIEKSTISTESSLFPIDDIALENLDIGEPAQNQNIKIALGVCKKAGVDVNQVIATVTEEVKNSESLFYQINTSENEIKFINGFAVNDVQSSGEFFNHWQNTLGGIENVNIIFNSRSDRPLRSVEFAKWFKSVKNIKKIIITGNHKQRTKIELIRNGIESNKIITWTKKSVKNVISQLNEISDPRSVFIGLGNISGDGLMIIDSLKQAVVKVNNDN